MPSLPIEDRLRGIVSDLHPGAVLSGLTPLKGGNSAAVSRAEVTLPSGEVKRYVVRTPSDYRSRDHNDAAQREFTLIETMHHIGLPVQRPVFLEPHTEANAAPLYVLEYCDGAPELAPKDVEDYIEQYASHLARLHRVDHRKLEAISYLGKVGVGWPEHRSQGVKRMRIDELRAATVGRPPSQAHENPPVLCHSDFWPGNLLWRDGQLVAIIDWEESLIGEPLYDLAICRLDLLWILGAEAVDRFTHRYAALSGHNLHNLPYWDLIAAMRPVKGIEEWAKSYPHLGRPDVTSESMMGHHAIFVADALARWI